MRRGRAKRERSKRRTTRGSRKRRIERRIRNSKRRRVAGIKAQVYRIFMTVKRGATISWNSSTWSCPTRWRSPKWGRGWKMGDGNKSASSNLSTRRSRKVK